MIVAQATAMERIRFCAEIDYIPTDHFRAIVLRNGDRMVAATGYDMWTKNSVQMHLLCRGQLTKNFIRECFRYPFEICEKGVVVGITPGDNEEALEINKRLGFVEVFRLKDGNEVGVDTVVQELRRENCRWINQTRKLEWVSLAG